MKPRWITSECFPSSVWNYTIKNLKWKSNQKLFMKKENTKPLYNQANLALILILIFHWITFWFHHISDLTCQYFPTLSCKNIADPSNCVVISCAQPASVHWFQNIDLLVMSFLCWLSLGRCCAEGFFTKINRFLEVRYSVGIKFGDWLGQTWNCPHFFPLMKSFVASVLWIIIFLHDEVPHD